MKKLVSFLTLIFCVSVLQANGGKKTKPWWTIVVSEKQVEKAKDSAKLFGIKAALWTARSQDAKSLVAPIQGTGYLFKDSDGNDCAFFPKEGHAGKGLYACFDGDDLEYGRAEGDCTVSGRKGTAIGSYKFKPSKFRSICRVYPTGV